MKNKILKYSLFGVISLSIIYAIFYAYNRIKRAKKDPQTPEQLKKFFSESNPFNSQKVEYLNTVYPYDERKKNPTTNWKGEARTKLASKSIFDNKVLTIIRQISQGGEWLDNVKKEMTQSWTPVSISGNNNSLAQAVAYTARGFVASNHYYDPTDLEESYTYEELNEGQELSTDIFEADIFEQTTDPQKDRDGLG